MKTLLMIASFSLSLNAFAFSSTDWGLLCDQTWDQKEVAQVNNDYQGFIQFGRLSPFLEQKIKDIQSQDSLVSEQEALDILISYSESLSK